MQMHRSPATDKKEVISMTAKKKKSSRDTRILIGALLIAGVIAGGSTFAWFTSKDEVTNRLSAKADYNVSIAEDFTPPEDWIPGQTINKDVSIVNTGNVDAFVRTWLEGEMRYIARDKAGEAIPASAPTTWGTLDTTKTDAVSTARLVPTADGGTSYVRVLRNTTTTAPTDYDEVISMQAGGWLAYAPVSCEWQYTEKAAASDPSNVSGDTTVTAGTGTSNATATYVAAGTYGCAINSDTFKPKTTGLYLFRRNMDMDGLDADNNVYYSGYYYVAPTSDAGYGNGTYYALNTLVTGTNSDNETVYAAYVQKDTTDSNKLKLHVHGSDTVVALSNTSTTDKLVADDVANVKLFKADSATKTNSDLTWTYDATNKKFTVAPTAGATGIKINVALVGDNVVDAGGTADKWQRIPTTGANTTFYYTNDLESGSTSSQLVDSVQLDETVTVNDYIAFDFDLNVKMDSIQVTMDSEGKETYQSVASAWAVTSGDAATPAYVSAATWTDNKELATLTWTAN